MRLLLILAVSLNLWGLHLTPYQESVRKRAEQLGKPYDLSLTLQAIVWQESSFGKNKGKSITGDCGVTQINTTSFLRRYADDLVHQDSAHDKICTMLTKDDDLAIISAIEELKYWLNQYDGNWHKAVSSYNGGWKGNKRYLKAIIKKVKYIRRHYGE